MISNNEKPVYRGESIQMVYSCQKNDSGKHSFWWAGPLNGGSTGSFRCDWMRLTNSRAPVRRRWGLKRPEVRTQTHASFTSNMKTVFEENFHSITVKMCIFFFKFLVQPLRMTCGWCCRARWISPPTPAACAQMFAKRNTDPLFVFFYFKNIL